MIRVVAVGLFMFIVESIFILQSLKTAFSAMTLLVGWHEGHSACRKLRWDAGMPDALPSTQPRASKH